MNNSFYTLQSLSTKREQGQEVITFQKGKVIGFAINRYYSNNNREIAHQLKQSDASAIQQAAASIRSIIASWHNVALVPVPSHLGYATYTLELAKAIGIGEIYDVLRCNQRETLYEQKLRGEHISPSSLGFYSIGSIPEDKNIVFVDNVVATGTTAIACFEALSRGVIVPFAVDC